MRNETYPVIERFFLFFRMPDVGQKSKEAVILSTAVQYPPPSSAEIENDGAIPPLLRLSSFSVINSLITGTNLPFPFTFRVVPLFFCTKTKN
jgi:hypothetical protein